MARDGSFAMAANHITLHISTAECRDCIARPELCLFHNMSGGWDEARDAAPLDDLMGAAWYVLHPQGDFIIRSAWFDTLFAGSIPAVFDAGYVDHLPYTDVLDYSRLMTTLPAVGPFYLQDTDGCKRHSVCSTPHHAARIPHPDRSRADLSTVEQHPHPLLSILCLSSTTLSSSSFGSQAAFTRYECKEGSEQQHPGGLQFRTNLCSPSDS